MKTAGFEVVPVFVTPVSAVAMLLFAILERGNGQIMTRTYVRRREERKVAGTQVVSERRAVLRTKLYCENGQTNVLANQARG